jgi:hypothetical protein
VGTGFSYSEEAPGSHANYTGAYLNASEGPVDGRWPVIDFEELDTTDKAAVAAYHILQGFYSALPSLDCDIKSKVSDVIWRILRECSAKIS